MFKAAKKKEVTIEPIQLGTLFVEIIGTTPLICNRFSEKSKKQILDKQTKAPKQARKAKNPREEYLSSLYPYPGGGYGFPASAFKKAAVGACSHVEGITKSVARGAFHVIGDLVKLKGSKPKMRQDTVRIPSGADIRHRAQFDNWSTTLEIKYNENVISDAQIVNLQNVAGFAIGVGEWRPQREGTFGMFTVGGRRQNRNGNRNSRRKKA